MDHELFAKEYHFRELGQRAHETMLAKVRAGKPSGRLPLGYLKNGKGAAEPDREKSHHLARAFAMVRDGCTLREILYWLEGEGVTGASGKPLGLSSLQALLTNPFYCGLVRYKAELYPGGHEPLFTKTLFNTVQRSLRKRRC